MTPTQTVRGFPFPSTPWFLAKNIEDTLDYIPHDDDIIIASYPKTGTTWLQYIVFQITSKGEFFPSFDECLYKHSPFLEVTGTAVLENMEKPRIYKHHCPYNMVQKNDKAKYIYIYRKPEDTVISFYHFMKELQKETPKLDEFFEDFISGNIGYGLYFDHVLSFFDQREEDGMLLVSYEKLLRNKREEILRIAKYLGEEYFQTLSENDSIMDKVLECTSFDYMKKNLTLNHPSENTGEKKVNFFRKGTIGDGKESLKSDQLKRLKELTEKKMDGTVLLEEWLND